MKLVSIIMPVYNTAQYLERAIRSVENQTYPNIELIIVDDASPDNAAEVYTQAMTRYNNIRVVKHEVNRGLPETRNTGIRASAGEWLLFLDSDDIIYEDAISCLIQAADEHTDFVLAKHITSINGIVQNEVKNGLHSGAYTRNKIAEYLFEELPLNVLSCVGTKLYRASVIKDNGVFFGTQYRYNEDLAFVIDLLAVCNQMMYLDKVVYEYDIRGSGSIQTSYRENLVKHLYITRRKLYPFFEKCGCLQGKKQALNKMWFGIALEALKQEYRYVRTVDSTLQDIYDNEAVSCAISEYTPKNVKEARIQACIFSRKNREVLRMIKWYYREIRLRKTIKKMIGKV